MRIILYRGMGRTSTLKEKEVITGYASGIDKVITEVEHYQLPAPLFERLQGLT
ncbi:MAG: hypothetical protein ACOYOE_02960 [Chlorobium sp.]